MSSLVKSNYQKGKNSSLLDREMPYNLEAERSILSAIILSIDNLDQVSLILNSDDFYYLANKIIYQAILDLYEKSKHIDFLVLHDYLQSHGKLEKVGGLPYLLDLQENISQIPLIEQHCKIIKEKSLLRSLIEASSHILSSCYSQNGLSINEILDDSERKIFAVSNKVATKDFVPLNSILTTAFKKLSTINSQDCVTGISSGFEQFDNLTSGMQNGDLIILAARPSMGKTTLALNLALNSWKAGHSVGIFSLEMPSEQLVLRMVSSESGIDYHKIRTGSISSEEWLELTNAAAHLDDVEIYIDDTPSITITELKAKARRLKQKHDIKMIVIDYLQLLSAGEKVENRTQEISLISRNLKSLAKELNLPVIALSQLSRSLESRSDKRPMLSDLRESGAIEQDADLVCFIYREVVYSQDSDNADSAELIIGKQRNGPIGTVYLTFHPEIIKFTDAYQDSSQWKDSE